MATLRCTGQLESQIGITLPSSLDVSPFDWHANLLWLEKRKHVLFCSDASRLICLTSVVSKTEIGDLPELLRRTLQQVMSDECFAQEVIQHVVAAHNSIKLAKTNSKSVLGTMNDNTRHIRYFLDRYGSLSQPALTKVHHHLNHMPMKPNGWKFSIESFRENVVELAQKSF